MWSHRIRGCLATLVVVCSLIRLSCSGTSTTQQTSTGSEKPVAVTSKKSTTQQVRTTSHGPACQDEGQFGCCRCGPGYIRKGKECVQKCDTGFYSKFKVDSRPLHEVCPELFTTLSPTTVNVNSTYTIQPPEFSSTDSSTGNFTSVGQTTTPQLSTQGPVEPISNYTCEQCPSGCSSCESESDCKTCDNGYLLFNGKRCITKENCASKGNFYSNGTHCSECHPACVNCTSYTTDEKDCTCRNYTHGGKCIDRCPSGTRVDGKKCTDQTPLSIPVIAGVAAGGLVLIIIIIIVIVCVCRRCRRSPEAPAPPPTLDDINRAETDHKRLSDPRQRPVYENVSNSVATTTDIQRGHDAVTRYTRDPTLPVYQEEMRTILMADPSQATSNQQPTEEVPAYGGIDNDWTIYQNLLETEICPPPRSAPVRPVRAVEGQTTESANSEEDGQGYANWAPNQIVPVGNSDEASCNLEKCSQEVTDEERPYRNGRFINGQFVPDGDPDGLISDPVNPTPQTPTQDQNLSITDPNVYGNLELADQCPFPRFDQGGQDQIGVGGDTLSRHYENGQVINGQFESTGNVIESSSSPLNLTSPEQHIYGNVDLKDELPIPQADQAAKDSNAPSEEGDYKSFVLPVDNSSGESSGQMNQPAQHVIHDKASSDSEQLDGNHVNQPSRHPRRK